MLHCCSTEVWETNTATWSGFNMNPLHVSQPLCGNQKKTICIFPGPGNSTCFRRAAAFSRQPTLNRWNLFNGRPLTDESRLSTKAHERRSNPAASRRTGSAAPNTLPSAHRFQSLVTWPSWCSRIRRDARKLLPEIRSAVLANTMFRRCARELLPTQGGIRLVQSERGNQTPPFSSKMLKAC